MTREKIINEIKCLLSELNNGEDAVSYLTQNDIKWLNENIKALEQKPILDKIKAEIKQLRIHKAQFLTNDNKVCIDSQEVLDILDKYKAESEGEA